MGGELVPITQLQTYFGDPACSVWFSMFCVSPDWARFAMTFERGLWCVWGRFAVRFAARFERDLQVRLKRDLQAMFERDLHKPGFASLALASLDKLSLTSWYDVYISWYHVISADITWYQLSAERSKAYAYAYAYTCNLELSSLRSTPLAFHSYCTTLTYSSTSLTLIPQIANNMQFRKEFRKRFWRDSERDFEEIPKELLKEISERFRKSFWKML